MITRTYHYYAEIYWGDGSSSHSCLAGTIEAKTWRPMSAKALSDYIKSSNEDWAISKGKTKDDIQIKSLTRIS